MEIMPTHTQKKPTPPPKPIPPEVIPEDSGPSISEPAEDPAKGKTEIDEDDAQIEPPKDDAFKKKQRNEDNSTG
jgi:hypothetical protein